MVSKQKTVREWLNMLKEPYKTQALKNSNHVSLRVKTNTLSQAINRAFVWNNTPEKNTYWYNIYNNSEDYINTNKSEQINFPIF